MNDQKTFDNEIQPVHQSALALRVIDSESNQEAGAILVRLKDLQKGIKSYFEPLKKTAHAAWKAVTDRESSELAKLDPTEKHLKAEMSKFKIECDRKAAEERARLEAEERAKIEAQRRELAAKMESAGKAEAAKTIIEAPIVVEAPKIQTPTESKVQGVQFKTVWEFEIEDVTKLPAKFLMPNTTEIRKIVTALKGDTQIPGVRVFSRQDVAAGRR